METDVAQNDAHPRPAFDVAVPTDGYRWWYVDGVSSDGRHGIVVIAFVGSVFSPYYFSARARGPTDPEEHVAINVGLYTPNGNLWAMTERSKASLERHRDSFRVGPSRLEWQDGRLQIDIVERSAPFARRIAGRVTVDPAFLNVREFTLDPAGRHRWHPVAPVGRVSVEMQRPALFWEGAAYFDTNAGERALEDDFAGWNWSRGHRGGSASITYAVTMLDGTEQALALDVGADGTVSDARVPPEVELPTTGWRVARATRSDGQPTVLRTLEDTPFYSRSLLVSGGPGDTHPVMHESLDLNRFKSSWVRTLLPFRMPRVR
jgi:carotenoid 1,2-hydratase